jgi:hypothetical protein
LYENKIIREDIKHFKTRCKQYFFDAGDGTVSMIRQEADPELEIPTFSIYGDY